MKNRTLFFLKRGFLDSYKLLLFELAKHRKEVLPVIPILPKFAAVYVTHNCNSKCITCNMWQNKSVNELSLMELEDTLIQLKDIGVVTVGFGGGEPLLRDDLPQIVGKAYQLGFESIGVITNGLLLTREKSEELIQKGLTSISISINGIGEKHNFTRGVKGGYERSLKALGELVGLRELKYPTFGLGINAILMRPTIDEIIPLAELARGLGISFGLALINEALPTHGGINVANLWIEEQNKVDELIDELHKLKRVNPALKSCSHTGLEYARRYFIDPKREDIPCYLGYLTIYIDAQGEVYPGCLPLGSMGNLRERRLKEIIGSQEYKSRVQAMFHKECPGCPCNREINLWYNLPTLIGEGLWKLGLRR